MIVEAARGEDAVALDVVDGAVRAIGVGVAAVPDLLNVDRVVGGGGVASAGFFLLERIAEESRPPTSPSASGRGRRARRDDRRGERL